MKQVRTSLNNHDYQKFLKQCGALEESEYRFVKNAVKERMQRKESFIKKMRKWLEEDHEF